jgi:hypothetical protein
MEYIPSASFTAKAEVALGFLAGSSARSGLTERLALAELSPRAASVLFCRRETSDPTDAALVVSTTSPRPRGHSLCSSSATRSPTVVYARSTISGSVPGNTKEMRKKCQQCAKYRPYDSH